MPNITLSANEYSAIHSFASTHKALTYEQFENALLEGVNLFVLSKDFDFERLDEALDRITAALPSIRRLFARPIIRLADRDEIMPIETVRVINNHTISHASSHSDLWSDITENGMKPQKLLTVGSTDNYVIYENIAFAHTINLIRRFVTVNLRTLREMLYAADTLNFNLLDRGNHPAYYLALGKLHYGYSNDYDRYTVPAQRAYNKLLFIDRIISSGISAPVYQKCKDRCRHFTLKKTTVFRTHKDYHRVYQLLKWFSQYGPDSTTLTDEESPATIKEGYDAFCLLITVFAVGHFNFKFKRDALIDFGSTDVTADFGNRHIRIETVRESRTSAIRLSVVKDTPYSVILIPAPDPRTGEMLCKTFRLSHDADEYIALTELPSADGSLQISLNSIESFRRIQQIVLRALVKSDSSHKLCPFCGKPTAVGAGDDHSQCFECPSCKTQIRKTLCPTVRLPFLSTSVMNFTPVYTPRKTTLEDNAEGILHYRNITAINKNGEILCPYCNSVHF